MHAPSPLPVTAPPLPPARPELAALARAMDYLDALPPPEPAPPAAHPPGSAAARVAALLEPEREALGPAHATLHTLMVALHDLTTAAGEVEPFVSVHALTATWAIQQLAGVSRRTVFNHLFDPRARWWPTVARYLDVREKYQRARFGPMDIRPSDAKIAGLVVRAWFRPGGRRDQALERVEGWALGPCSDRDFQADARAGLTERSNIRLRRESKNLHDISVLLKHVLDVDMHMHEGPPANENAVEQEQVSVSPALARSPGSEDMSCKSELGRMGRDFRLEELVAPRLGTPQLGPLVEALAGRIVAELEDTAPLPGSGYADNTRQWMRALWCGVRALSRGQPFVLERVEGAVLRGRIALEEKAAGEVFARGLESPAAYAMRLVRLDDWAEIERDFGPGTGRALGRLRQRGREAKPQDLERASARRAQDRRRLAEAPPSDRQ